MEDLLHIIIMVEQILAPLYLDPDLVIITLELKRIFNFYVLKALEKIC